MPTPGPAHPRGPGAVRDPADARCRSRPPGDTRPGPGRQPEANGGGADAPDGEARVLFRGKPYRLRVRLASVRRSAVYAVRDDLWLLVAPQDRRTPEAIFVEWLKGEARRLIPPRVAELARRFGFRYGRVFIRSQRTRWGTCSSRGHLSFNFRLVLAPPEVLDYLIVHELAHLRVPNHSRAFWELVARMCPSYRQCRRWLRIHEPALMAVGRFGPAHR